MALADQQLPLKSAKGCRHGKYPWAEFRHVTTASIHSDLSQCIEMNRDLSEPKGAPKVALVFNGITSFVSVV